MGEGGAATDAGASGRPAGRPWYARGLAVGYVLSMVAGPVGFFVLAGVGSYLVARDGPARGGDAAIAFAAALACPLGCAGFRWWVRGLSGRIRRLAPVRDHQGETG